MDEAPQEQADLRTAEDVDRRYALEQRRMSLEYGLLGWICGDAAKAPIYITGIIVVLFAIMCALVLFVPSNVPAADFQKLVIPLISVALGYLFGKIT